MSSDSEIGSRIHHRHLSESEDDEESLSLSDLPLLPRNSDRQENGDDGKRRETGEQREDETEAKNDASDDFDFGSLVASLDALESEMCAADDVFYRGQILPFRHSVSSASAAGVSSNLARTVSRSESMDRIVESGFRSSSTASSSRSSSTRSSSISSSASASKLSSSYLLSSNSNSSSFPNYNQKRSFKVRNQFHSFPSPRPYARAPTAPRTSTSSNPSTKKSPLWEIFRLGLVRTPEIELEDLKFRYGKNQIQSSGAPPEALSHMNRSDSRSSGKGKIESKQSHKDEPKKRKKKEGRRSSEKRSLMSSCKCSVGAVEPEKTGVEKQRKPDMSRHHRTFEWLKDLSSHALVLNDD